MSYRPYQLAYIRINVPKNDESRLIERREHHRPHHARIPRPQVVDHRHVIRRAWPGNRIPQHEPVSALVSRNDPARWCGAVACTPGGRPSDNGIRNLPYPPIPGGSTSGSAGRRPSQLRRRTARCAAAPRPANTATRRPTPRPIGLGSCTRGRVRHHQGLPARGRPARVRRNAHPAVFRVHIRNPTPPCTVAFYSDISDAPACLPRGTPTSADLRHPGSIRRSRRPVRGRPRRRTRRRPPARSER